MIWILSVSAASAIAAAPERAEPDWPKKIENEEATVTVYQPQINSLEGDLLDARAAVSIKPGGEKMVFGAMWFTSRLVTDFDTRQVTLNDLDIVSVKFPDADEEQETKMIELLEAGIQGMGLTISLDRLLVSLEVAEQEIEMTEHLEHTPPRIIFARESSVLVLIDGEPILEDIEDTPIQYVVNTPYFILYNKADGFFYLKGGDWWYRAGRVENTWRQIDTPPNSILEIQLSDESYQTDVDSIARTLAYPPKVILSKEPAELIITDGEPDFAPLEGTDLLYVKNTESEILMDINSQEYYLLIAGRWYKSSTLDDQGWEFVSPDNLPEYFANIDRESEMGSVRSSVPGTREAREATLENQIPQTAEIDRKSAKVEVNYDGNPQFERIKGTEMSYAVNTDKSVLYIDQRYYVCDNAVWFVSDHATGPWQVCVSVPDNVQSIPPEYPVYNVKYVYVYDYTPEIVYVGYTPGYVYSYSYHGTVVYGTGYYYRPWHRTYYYPRPVTYGFGVHYNPYTGWGFSVGLSYGWIGYSYYRRPYYYSSWWGPAGYRYGYRHGYYHGYSRSYYHGYYRGYSYGVYASSRSGYRTAPHHISHQNLYKSRTSGVVHTGTRPTTYGSRTGSSASRSSYSRPSTTDRKNNVYTDRNGNVYRKKGENWQTRENGSWKKSGVPDRSRTGSRAETGSTPQRTPSAADRGRENARTQRPTPNRYSSGSRSGSGTSSAGRGRTGYELRQESRARSQGSQRSYQYQQSQQSRQGTTSGSTRRSTGNAKSKGNQSRSGSSRSDSSRDKRR
jgi:hypothetical protein